MDFSSGFSPAFSGFGGFAGTALPASYPAGYGFSAPSLAGFPTLATSTSSFGFPAAATTLSPPLGLSSFPSTTASFAPTFSSGLPAALDSTVVSGFGSPFGADGTFGLPVPALPKLKITYFPIRGRAEAVRLACFISGFEFEDVRVEGKTTWPEMKKDAKFEQLPLLEINGQQLAQSIAQLRYVGRLGAGNLYPADPLDAAFVDEALYLVDDINAKVAKTLYCKDEERDELRKELAEEVLPKYFGYVEKLLESNPAGAAGFFVGPSLTIADLSFYQTFWWVTSGTLDNVPKDCLDSLPACKALWEKIDQLPKIQEWYEKHQ